jgi:hypothetical protein
VPIAAYERAERGSGPKFLILHGRRYSAWHGQSRQSVEPQHG